MTIEALEPRHHEGIRRMMSDIKTEFSLPDHDPAYRPPVPTAYWVALAGEEVAGTAALIMQEDYAVLKNVFVKLEHRGSQKGISQALLDTAISYARKAGCSHIYLGTMDAFKAAQKFYLKNGFSAITREELPHSFPHSPMDSLFFKAALKHA